MLYHIRVGTYSSRKNAYEVVNEFKAADHYPDISRQ